MMIVLDIVTAVCIGLLIGTEFAVSVFINPILRKLDDRAQAHAIRLFARRSAAPCLSGTRRVCCSSSPKLLSVAMNLAICCCHCRRYLDRSDSSHRPRSCANQQPDDSIGFQFISSGSAARS